MNEYIFFNDDRSILEYLKKLYKAFSNYFPKDFDEFGRLEDIFVFINGRYFQYFTIFLEKQNLINDLMPMRQLSLLLPNELMVELLGLLIA